MTHKHNTEGAVYQETIQEGNQMVTVEKTECTCGVVVKVITLNRENLN